MDNKPFISLKVLYDNLPATSGCENCESVNKDNSYWCCKSYSPSMFYVEFLHIWKDINNRSNTYKQDLVIKSIKNYLIDSVNKTCPFWKDECTVYDKRPFSCREYGIIPEEIWDERIKYLKSKYGDDYPYKSQCNIVKVTKGQTSKELSNKRFLHIQKCEVQIGVDPIKVKNYTDDDSTYRVAHDHILLELFDEKFLSKLTEFKLSKPPINEIEDFIKKIIEGLDANLPSKM